jgi:alpha-tubulin suppressor-like RCC1 family protein
LWVWGSNSNGELGFGKDREAKPYPTPMKSMKNKEIKQVVCGGSFSIAIGKDNFP